SLPIHTHRFECPVLGTENLITIQTGQSDRSDLAGPLTQVEIRRSGNVDASIRQVHTSLRIMRKAGEEFASKTKNLMWLLARLSNLLRDHYVAAVSILFSVGITGQRFRRKFLPRHHGAGIESARQGDAHPLASI